MKNSSVVAILFSSYVVITTIIVYALVVAITFFEIDKALGGENFVVDNNKMMIYNTSQQVEVETRCKSPCPLTAEMCIQICA